MHPNRRDIGLGHRLATVKLRSKVLTWRDLLAVVYEPAEIEEMIRAGKMRDLLFMASRPGMPEGLFTSLAVSIASDPQRTPAERNAARRALRTATGLRDAERDDMERERMKKEFARLPARPEDVLLFYWGPASGAVFIGHALNGVAPRIRLFEEEYGTYTPSITLA